MRAKTAATPTPAIRAAPPTQPRAVMAEPVTPRCPSSAVRASTAGSSAYAHTQTDAASPPKTVVRKAPSHAASAEHATWVLRGSAPLRRTRIVEARALAVHSRGPASPAANALQRTVPAKRDEARIAKTPSNARSPGCARWKGLRALQQRTLIVSFPRCVAYRANAPRLQASARPGSRAGNLA